MYKKNLSVMLLVLLVYSMSGRAVLADTPTKTETARRNERMQATVSKLVRDAKAERNTPLIAVPQSPNARGNNLSTGAKVAIGVGIVAAIVVIIFVVKSPILNDGR